MSSYLDPSSQSRLSPTSAVKHHLYRENPLNRSIRRTDPAEIQVEDDRTGMTVETLKRAFADNLYYILGRDEFWANLHHYYMALAYTVRDRLLHRWIKTTRTYFERDVKTVFYLSLEFLMGRQMGNNLINVGLYERARQAVQESGLNLNDLIEQELEPGLGNGGLGRLAACFLDSLATLGIPAVGYGIHYEFGIFDQTIQDGWQVERPDPWLRFGNPWEMPRLDYRIQVNLGGHTEPYTDQQGQYRVRWIPERTVYGSPYDMPVPGYANNTVNTLRLWSAKASEEFNFEVFNAGDYTRAVADKIFSENISKVLYPNDNTPQGKELRLAQQYFFVACSLHDIVLFYRQNHNSFDAFPEKVAIQLNDTHPAIAIPELLRLLLDEYGLGWDEAWAITQRTFAYTNHTLLPEALECWPIRLFAHLLPRHLELIYEINRRFLDEVRQRYPGDDARLARLSIIEEGPEKQIRMAHLACVGSHGINGVSELHSYLMQQHVLHDFYELWPDRFSNKTNGVTPRRWILLSNPKLALLITHQMSRLWMAYLGHYQSMGSALDLGKLESIESVKQLARVLTNQVCKRWVNHLEDLRQLEKSLEDEEFCKAWQQVKHENKQDLAEYIQQTQGITINPDSLFDVQVKRIHEYKRQVLNVLHIITLYNQIKANPQIDLVPRTFIFGGKAAPGYSMAKLVIKLINAVADVVNHDPDVGDRLKVVFLPNYSVSLAERICPAADLSEQISTAGKEASGTGNMKFAMNGALTIGTLDGSNIEIRDAVGEDNFFLFGLPAEAVITLKQQGYDPWHYYNRDPQLQAALDRLQSGYFTPEQPQCFLPLVESLLSRDRYLVLADYAAYVKCQAQVSEAYRDRDRWTRMSILNVARIGKFSSDRTIREYCQDIWHVQPVPIELDEYQPARAGLDVHRMNSDRFHAL